MKITLCASSSGGHIYPALALGNYLLMKGYDVNYIGFKNQMEEEFFPKEKTLLLVHSNSFKKSIKELSISNSIKAIRTIRKWITDADAIVLFGGYITFLVSIAANISRKTYYLHEQNVILGDSNIFAYLGAKKVFRCFNKNNCKKEIICGNPSADLVRSKRVIIHKETRVLFVFGSLGSSSLLNKTMDFIMNTKLTGFSFTIINKLENYLKYTNYPQTMGNMVEFMKYLDLRKEIDNYDIIFTRSGATTLSELMKTSLYVVTIPSPNVKHNHQKRNAEFLFNKGLVSIIEEKNYNLDSIEKEIEKYMSDPYCRYNLNKNREELFSNNASFEIERIIRNDYENKI